jgi:tetratricopeptide (TPR) repeat protein
MPAKDIATIIISSIALIVSAFSAYVSIHQKKLETERTVRTQVTDTIDKLVEVENALDELRNRKPSTTEPAVSPATLGRLKDRRLFLARHGAYLVNQIPHLVTDIEYFRLAVAFSAGRDFLQSETFFRKAIEAADEDRYRAQNVRGLARLLFEQGNAEQGRAKFRDAITLLAEVGGDTGKDLRGDTYRRWAESERDFGDRAQAEHARELAAATFRAIRNDRMRDGALKSVENFWGKPREPGSGAPGR